MRELLERSGDTVVASGYGIRINVNRGQLVIDDGYGQHRRTRRFSRAASNFQRLAIVGSEGLITSEAIRWITDIEATYIHIDSTGRLIGVGGWYPGNNPALRRRQALASHSPAGLELARWLIDANEQRAGAVGNGGRVLIPAVGCRGDPCGKCWRESALSASVL